MNPFALMPYDNITLFHVTQQQRRDDAYQDALTHKSALLKAYVKLDKRYDDTVELIRYTSLCATHYYYDNGSSSSLELDSHYIDAADHLDFKCDDKEVLTLLLNLLRYAYEGQRTWRRAHKADKAVDSLEDEWGKECRDFALEYVRDEYLKHGIE